MSAVLVRTSRKIRLHVHHADCTKGTLPSVKKRKKKRKEKKKGCRPRGYGNLGASLACACISRRVCIPVLFPPIACYLHTPSLSSVLRQQHNSMHMHCVHPLNLNGITARYTWKCEGDFCVRTFPEAVRPEAETYGLTADQEETGANYCREMWKHSCKINDTVIFCISLLYTEHCLTILTRNIYAGF